MSKIFARLRRARLLPFCPGRAHLRHLALLARRAFKSYRFEIGRTFRISSEYGCSGTIQRSTKTWADESYTYCNMDVGSLGRDTLYIPP